LLTPSRSSYGHRVSVAAVAAVAAFMAVALCRGISSAHVAPSLQDNNRFLKLGLLADRLRLVVTVFFGEVPGTAERHAIDADRDGQLSKAETDRFAARLAAELEGQVELRVDGTLVLVTFAQRHVGLATTATTGGAFSIDLVATACLPPGASHQISYRDRFTLPRPGETEVRIENSPGLTVSEATLGAITAVEGVFRFAGQARALADPGLSFELRLGADAVAPRDGRCTATAAAATSSPRWLIAVAMAAAVVALAVASQLLRRRRAVAKASLPRAG
jgi:hypothetical protein